MSLSKKRAVALVLVMAMIVMSGVLPATAGKKKKKKKPPKPTKVECAVEGQIIDKGNGWTSIKLPEFPSHQLPETPVTPKEDGSTRLVISPHDPTLIFVYSQKWVLRSTDGGCTWTEVFGIPELPSSSNPRNGIISQVEIPASPEAKDHVYVVVPSGSYSEGGIMRSTDRGDSWERWDQGLPSTGTGWGGLLRIAPSDPDTVYITGSIGLYGVMWARTGSSDGWELRGHILSTGSSCQNMQEFCGAPPGRNWTYVIDSTDPQRLWGWLTSGSQTEPIVRSFDGGRSWSWGLDEGCGCSGIREAPYFDVNAIDFWSAPGETKRILLSGYGADASGREVALESGDNGETWATTTFAIDDGINKPNYLFYGGAANRYILFNEGTQAVSRYDSRVGRFVVVGHYDGWQHPEVIHHPDGVAIYGLEYSDDRASIMRYTSKRL